MENNEWLRPLEMEALEAEPMQELSTSKNPIGWLEEVMNHILTIYW